MAQRPGEDVGKLSVESENMVKKAGLKMMSPKGKMNVKAEVTDAGLCPPKPCSPALAPKLRASEPSSGDQHAQAEMSYRTISFTLQPFPYQIWMRHKSPT